MSSPDRVVAIVGDSTISLKSHALALYLANKPAEDFVDRSDRCMVKHQYDNITYEVELRDIEEEHDRLRALSYVNADFFMLFFSVVAPTTFESVKTKWNPEISHFCTNVPKMLVGVQPAGIRNYDEAKLQELNCTQPVTKASQDEEEVLTV